VVNQPQGNSISMARGTVKSEYLFMGLAPFPSTLSPARSAKGRYRIGWHYSCWWYKVDMEVRKHSPVVSSECQVKDRKYYLFTGIRIDEETTRIDCCFLKLPYTIPQQ
jgi:hypothetical protein